MLNNIFMDDNVTEIMALFNRLINRINMLEKVPRNFETEDLLCPAEIHTIDVIGRNHGINVTEIALKLGVTKGAVSQMASKLAEKNLVRKTRDIDNDKDVILELTEKGKQAFTGHEKFHMEMIGNLTGYLENISKEQANLFKDFLDKVDHYLTQYIE